MSDPNRLFLLLLAAGLTVAGAGAQTGPQNSDQKRRIEVLRIDSEIVIDGEMDEPAWQRAETAKDFIQQEPIMGEPTSERTEVRLLYDDTNLYIGIYCFDSAGEEGIIVTNVRRDVSPFEGDYFGVLLDTFNDDRNAFVFGTNPRGAKRDGQMAGNGESSNFDWDAVWHVKSKITEQGWQAEMAIPFKTLRFREGEDQVWGLNLTRKIRRKNEDAHWAPIPRPFRINRVSLAGELNGLSGISQGRNLYIKPYLSLPVVRREQDDVDFLPEPGLDLKWGVTPGLTLDLTVNTDFAQVEADEQQINLTRFSLFFPEKREFFLEMPPSSNSASRGENGVPAGVMSLLFSPGGSALNRVIWFPFWGVPASAALPGSTVWECSRCRPTISRLPLPPIFRSLAFVATSWKVPISAASSSTSKVGGNTIAPLGWMPT